MARTKISTLGHSSTVPSNKKDERARKITGGRAPRKQFSLKKPLSTNNEKPRKKHRFRPGTRAMKEIRKLQKSIELCLTRTCINNHARTMANKFAIETPGGIRFQKKAIDILHEAADKFANDLIRCSYEYSINAKRITLLPKDYLSFAQTQMFISPESPFSRCLYHMIQRKNEESRIV